MLWNNKLQVKGEIDREAGPRKPGNTTAIAEHERQLKNKNQRKTVKNTHKLPKAVHEDES